MASVTIYSVHKDILYALITSKKVSAVEGGTKTGPFKAQRDAFVFAASIGFALGDSGKPDMLPTSKADSVTIPDRVFMGAVGAPELSNTAALLDESDEDSTESGLVRQLDLINEDHLNKQFEILDRYAFIGFEWLRANEDDESSIQNLVLAAIDQVASKEHELEDFNAVRDPLMDMLL